MKKIPLALKVVFTAALVTFVISILLILALGDKKATNTANEVSPNKTSILTENKIENVIENTIENAVKANETNQTNEITTSNQTNEATVSNQVEPVTTTNESAIPVQNEKSQQYVLNINSMKFHKPNCSSVSKMKDSNKEYYNGSRSDIIDMGYTPCKICNP